MSPLYVVVQIMPEAASANQLFIWDAKNVIEAVKCADTMGIHSIVLTGKSGGLLSNGGSVTIRIPSDDTQRIQEGHITAGHILCELVENSIR